MPVCRWRARCDRNPARRAGRRTAWITGSAGTPAHGAEVPAELDRGAGRDPRRREEHAAASAVGTTGAETQPMRNHDGVLVLDSEQALNHVRRRLQPLLYSLWRPLAHLAFERWLLRHKRRHHQLVDQISQTSAGDLLWSTASPAWAAVSG